MGYHLVSAVSVHVTPSLRLFFFSTHLYLRLLVLGLLALRDGLVYLGLVEWSTFETCTRPLAILVFVRFPLLTLLVLGTMRKCFHRLLSTIDNVYYALEALALQSRKLDHAPRFLGKTVFAPLGTKSPHRSQVDNIARCTYAQHALRFRTKYQAPTTGHTYELRGIANQISLCAGIIGHDALAVADFNLNAPGYSHAQRGELEV